MKPPRFAAVAFALVFALVMPAMASAAVDQAEWDAAVAAAQQVDPSLSPPPNDPTLVNAVGGGRLETSANTTFGFGATLGPGGLNGQMTHNFFGQTFSATLVCFEAAALEDGSTIATLIGELKPNSAMAQPLMVFNVTDGGQGAQGDAWSVGFIPEPPGPLSCPPMPGTQAIDGAIAINVP
jgi:hypothetical protein